MRTFLGIGLPEEVRQSLERLQQSLTESKADVTWVSPANLHVTLKFLGEISETQRQAVEALLGRLASPEESFVLGLKGLGAFPSFEAPRVIWVGLTEGGMALARLAEAIEREGASIPLRRAEQPFAAHLTLGRVRSPRNRQALTRRLRETDWQPPSSWRVASVTLYQSILTPKGPRYTVLADIPLKG